MIQLAARHDAEQLNDMRLPRTIDLACRPSTYFWARRSGIALTSDIKGAERRKAYQRALASGDADRLDPAVYAHTLSADDRTAIGRIHPAMMGGEYLPTAQRAEVEIARITIASTTQDVTSVYARPVGQRIGYRVVDEYGGDTLADPKTRTSVKPLTLKQLVAFFLGSWDLLGVLDMNFSDSGYDPESVKAFVIDADSSFYADFGSVIDARINTWLDQVRRGIAD